MVQAKQQIQPTFRLPWRVLAAVAFAILLLVSKAPAQITGSLSGTVLDTTGAVVPSASVTLINEASNDSRAVVTNNAGYFTFAAVQAGSYAIVVKTSGFETWMGRGILMNAGDIREVPNIHLKVGVTTQTVSVTADAAQIVPTDSGERSDVISGRDLERLSLESRNISEILKILPGVTEVAGGTSGGGSVDFSAVGPTGSTDGVGYSTSGAPYRGGTSYLLDGANIIDPGCNCWSIAVPNPDMTAEVKVNQAFAADEPNGPVVINTTSKSGGNQFHGQGYFYARNQKLNSNTWQNDLVHSSNPTNGLKQPGQYYYPGGNIGGPVIIPQTDFNKNRDKLFFWFGYEYYKQTLPSGAPLESFIPSAGMMGGNFTSSGQGNSALCPSGFTAGAKNWCGDPTGTNDANGNPITNATAVHVDPGAAALMKMFPAANADPTTTGGYNYYLPYGVGQNGYVWRGRVDYNINANNKIFAAYQTGSSTYVSVAHVWWTPWLAIAYPGGDINQPTTSRALTVNMVNVIRPTLTNEFVFGWGYANEPFSPSNLKAIYKSTLGYPYQTLYNSASQVAPSINQGGWQTFPDISQPAFYNSSGQYVTLKATPSFADNVSKVWKTHTFKAGGFTELVGNNQGAWSYPNGQLSFGNQASPNKVTGSTVAAGTSIGSSNPTANLVQGIASWFSQNNFASAQDQAYRTTSVYVLDNWQVRPRLTVNAGIRWDHVGRWYDRTGQSGSAVWYPQLFSQDVATNQQAGKQVVEYPGVRWLGIDSGIPNGGYPTRLAWATPRVGFAYDVQGNGRTVVRGGWGEYTWNDQPLASPLATAQNMQTYNSPGGQAITLSQIPLQTPSGNNQPAGSVTATPYDDYQDALTYAWNLTVDRQLPWHSLLEVAYVGNSTHHMLMGGQSDAVGIGGSEFSNVNKIPLGGLFKPDPITGAAAPADPENTAKYNIEDYYPYSGCVNGGGCYGYGTNSVAVQYHTGISNYNGLQAAWLKQQGRASWNFNYTWSKSLGIISSTLDAFNVRGNYGIESIDRPQVFNASYAYSIGNVYKGGEKLVGGAVNGWNISGVTTFQAGGNLQAEYQQNLGLSIQNTATGLAMTSKTYFGTDADSLLPITTCNPKSGLSSQKLLNLSCFSAPVVGTQGDRQIHPYLGGPLYTDSDLTIYKTFNITERQNVEFRAAAFDFMNHSLWGFSTNSVLQLLYTTSDGGHTFQPDTASYGSISTTGSCSPGGTVWGCENIKSPYSGAGYARIVELSLKYNF